MRVKLNFNNSREKKPGHMQACICFDNYVSGLRCYVYDDLSKYWCTQTTTEHDPDGENHVCDYADNRMTMWASASDPCKAVKGKGKRWWRLGNIRRTITTRVLLCDLDGTIIVTKSGKRFAKDKNDWKFKPLIKKAIRAYRPTHVFIVTNQGGIEKGYITRVDFQQKLEQIMSEMRTWGDFVVDGVFCSSNDLSNSFRKPNTGMVDFFRHGHGKGYNFSNRNALMIGDASGLKGQFSDSDAMCAKNAGIKYCDVEDFIDKWAEQ